MIVRQLKENRRLTYFDKLKGIAIFFVVLGHCLQTLMPDWQGNNVTLLIYMFHMPLFTIISGYFFYLSVKRYIFYDFVSKKFIHLYLPSLFWGLIQICIICIHKVLNNSVLEFSYLAKVFFTGAWFLTLLFILNIIGACIEHFFSSICVKIWLLFYCLIYVLPTYFMVNELKFLIPFFVIGILWKRYEIMQPSNISFLLALAMFILCFHEYNFDYSLYMMQDDILNIDYHVKNVIRFLSGVSGIICICYLCKYIPQKLSNILLHIGTITLPIYVLHQKLLLPIRILNYKSDNMFIIIGTAILCIFLTILCYKLLSTFKFLRLFCFGEK